MKKIALFFLLLVLMGCSDQDNNNRKKENLEENVNESDLKMEEKIEQEEDKEKEKTDLEEKGKDLARIFKIYQKDGIYYADFDEVTYYTESYAVDAAMADGVCTKRDYCLFRNYFISNKEEEIETLPLDDEVVFKKRLVNNDSVVTTMDDIMVMIEKANQDDKNQLLFDISIKKDKIVKISKRNIKYNR